MTGGRMKQIKKYIKNEEFFCMTYGDGVANINITKLIEFQRLFFSNENLVNINFYSELSGKISELSDSVKQLRLMSSIEFLSSD